MNSPRARFRGRPSPRAVSPIIGTILLVAIMIVLVAVLYAAIVVVPPPPQVTMRVTSNYNDTNVDLYGAEAVGNLNPPSVDCPGASQVCTVPGDTFTIASLSGTVSTSQVQVIFSCNGLEAQSGPLTSIINPASQPAVGASHPNSGLCPNQPTGGPTCLNYPGWVQGTLVDTIYYLPTSSGSTTLNAGGEFVVYGSVCNTPIGTPQSGFFYGPPQECDSGQVSCTIELLYTGTPNSVLATLSLSA